MSLTRRAIAGATVVAVTGVGYAAYSASADDTSYRTVAATTGDVEQTLDLTGAVEPAGRADLAFATSGTIDRITVAAGEKVRAGEVLGTLDDTGLRKTLQQARATLAAARAQLESDEDAQADTVAEATSTTSTPATPSTTAPSAQPSSEPSNEPSSEPSSDPEPDDGGDDALAELAAQQEAVTSAQSTVSASLAAARDALTAQQAACAAAFTTTPEPTPEPSDGTTEAPTDEPTDEPTDDTDQACTDALTAVQTAQQQVATDQDALQEALETLAGTLTAAAASSGEDTPTTPTTPTAPTAPSASASPAQQSQPQSQPQTQSQTPTTETPSAGGATGGTGSVSAAGLARDQSAIDTAKADLVAAQQELRMATVTAPFAGEIVAVDASVGASVSSGTEVFVLVSRGTTTVQVDATSTQVEQLAVGQAVTATPAGSDQPLAGTVTQISTVPDDASTYPVTVTLERKHLDIATGLNASVSVVTGTAKQVVTVPASAVTDGTVSVQEGGTVTSTRVTTGVVGATTVEIVDGLSAGDVVVLADLDRALPTTDDSSNLPGGVGGGGFGGGGMPGGGTGGPPAMMQR